MPELDPSASTAISAPSPAAPVAQRAPSDGTLGALWSGPAWRAHLALSAIFLVTRVGLYAAGLRFKLDLAWMFLSDPAALRERLFETVYYFHAFAPGMNILTGVLAKLAPANMAGAATVVFWASGWLLLASSFELFKAVGLSGRAAAITAVAFSLLPQSLYLENLYLYTHPCTALACAALVLFQRARARRSTALWLGCFGICAVLGWLYTTFHLLWFGAVVAGALLVSHRGARRQVLMAMAGPLLLLVALYAKNYAVFGVFGATSWGGANLTLATTQRMPKQLRAEWIRDGKLSPFAGISVFAPPQDYLRFLPGDSRYPWPTTNELWRPSVKAGNYNHGLFLEVNRTRREDSKFYLKERPLEYLKTVFGHNLVGFFSATTHWHPNDRRPGSSHYEHRRVLGGYERLYDLVVHGFPPRVGLYVAIVPLCVWGVLHVLRALRSRVEAERARAVALASCLFQIAFIGGVSCAFSSLESSRYRYTVEPCIWAVTAAALSTIAARRRRSRAIEAAA